MKLGGEPATGLDWGCCWLFIAAIALAIHWSTVPNRRSWGSGSFDRRRAAGMPAE